MAYYLSESGYDVTVLEKNTRVGGLARTCYYSGHPYEFGPHIWFWPGGKENPINATIVKLTGDELYYIDRRLFTYVEADRRKYRYPVHYQDVALMPERDADRTRAARESRRQPEADRVAAAGNRKLQVLGILHRGHRADALRQIHG